MRRLYFNVYLNGKRVWSVFTKKEAEEIVANMREFGSHKNDEIVIARGSLYDKELIK